MEPTSPLSLPDAPASVVIIPDVLKEGSQISSADTYSLTDETASLISALTEVEAPTTSGFKVKSWNGKTLFSDFIQEGLLYQKRKSNDVIMLFESPTSCTSADSSFYNSQVYKFHDYPRSEAPWKAILAPCRYSLMNGSSYPTYLQGMPPKGLLEHWKANVPGFVEPSFVSTIDEQSLVYAYLPMEQIKDHLNDPHVHYHLAGKDAIGLMTQKTTKLYNNTKDHRPCICKTTHSMASKGIFVIRNNEDDAQFSAYLEESGNPSFIVTQYIDISRNVACHFFIHPNGEITWFGSNENLKNPVTGEWSSDSHIVMRDQNQLREMQMPFVKDVVQYCHSLGFWGSCGVDVLFDTQGQGYLVDVNPRVTGSCPAIMTSHLLKEQFGFEYCLFRRSLKYSYRGSAEDLLRQVEMFNQENIGSFRIVLYSFYEVEPTETLVNIGVHGGTCIADCEAVLNVFAPEKEVLN